MIFRLPVLMILFLLFDTFGATAVRPEFPQGVNYVANHGQWDPKIRYSAGFNGGRLFLEDHSFLFVFEHPDDAAALHPHQGPPLERMRMHAVRMKPVGATSCEITGEDQLPYHHNYFIGKDARRWASGVPLYRRVTYHRVYPGIDLQLYSSFSDVKYDFIVSPSGDPSKILIDYEGADRLYLKEGVLHMVTSVGDIAIQRPYAYQRINGQEKQVDCRFVLRSGKVTFDFSKGYDHRYPLVIDPTLVFSSFTGSTEDNWGYTATYDAAGNLYAGGNIHGIGYPVTTGAYQVNFAGGTALGNGWESDMAIAKFNATGTTLLYATYIGGTDNEQPQSLVVDASNHLVIFGTTNSSNYPVTPSAYDTSLNGLYDIVISKLSTNGDSMLASTYLGGYNDDGINTSAIFSLGGPLKYNYGDESRGEIITTGNNEYIIGSCTKSNDFPVTGGALQTMMAGGIQDGVIFRINSSLSALVWSSFLGGTNDDAVYDLLIDSNNELYIAGGTTSPTFPTTPGVLHPNYCGGSADGFLTHLNASANSLLASTFIGTAAYDQTYFIDRDEFGNIYTCGQTEGSYPVSPGAYSNPNSGQFIHKLNPSLSATIYSTVFGNGTTYPSISPTAFLVDTCMNVYVSGWGRCLDFGGSYTPGNVIGMPITADAMQTTTDGCDFYFIILNSTAGNLVYATYFGGPFSQEHVDGGTSRFDKNGVIYQSVCAGCGGNSDFPTTPGVVSTINPGPNCNNGVLKLAFNVSRTIAAATPLPSSGCVPLTVDFNNTSINGEQFRWDFGDGSPIDTNFYPTHTYTQPGVYQVRLIAFNSTTCISSDTAYTTVTVRNVPAPTASFVLTTQPGCSTPSVQLTFNGNGGSAYQWYFGDGSNGTGTSLQHTYATTGSYDIVLLVTDTACGNSVDTARQTVTFFPPVDAVATAAPVSGGCLPVTVNFSSSGTTAADVYWNFGDGSAPDTVRNPAHQFLVAGTYYVLFIAADSFSCNLRDTSLLIVNVQPSIPLDSTFQLIPSSVCDSYVVQLSSTPAPGAVISWDLGDGTTNASNSFTHTYAAPGNYLIRYTISDTVCGSSATSMQLVHFSPRVQAVISTGNIQEGCAPQTILLSNAAAAAGSYEWLLGDGSLSNDSILMHTYTRPGTYHLQLTVSDPFSCNRSSRDTITLIVHPGVAAVFSVREDHGLSYTQVLLDNRSANADQYVWDFGDGTTSTNTDEVHRFTTPGDYTICLYAQSAYGCADTSCYRVRLEEEESIFLPNTFTPNGDGKNETFKAECIGILELHIEIYNRWGRMIHEITTPGGYWDGKTDGIPAPEAVYVYRLTARGVVHDHIERTGKVTLVR